jgi:hypothetical protein
MAKGIIGEPFTFTVLFLDANNEPITPSSVVIEAFYFDSSGSKQSLVAGGTPMSAVTGDTGRYAYTFTIPGALTPADQIYGVMTGVDPVSGDDIVVEQEVDPFESGSVGAIEIQDEGVSLGTFTVVNFVGADVEVVDVGGVATVYIPPLPPPPPPSYASHWNTSDGDNGNQSVSDGVSRTTTRISTPSGGEGSPFKTGGWAGTNQSTTRGTTATFTTSSVTTGFGGDATAEITVYDADGVTSLDAYTTPALTGDGVNTSPSGHIVATVSSFGVDDPNYPDRKSAKLSVAVDIGAILTALGLSGGRYHVEITFNADTATDGSGAYPYTQSDVFIDSNPTTPSISGTTTLSETASQVVTRYLSGVIYYNTGSAFTVNVTGIDQLMRNTARTSNNLSITPSGVSSRLSTLNQSPFGSGSGNFAGWTNVNTVDGVSYSKDDWALTGSNYRLMATNLVATAQARDTWASGNSVASAAFPMVVDTYGISSTDTAEYFNDENRRQDSTYNGGATTGNWNSSAPLNPGEALVCEGRIQVPNQGPVLNWSAYNPTGGPDYTSLGGSVSYYRTFVDTAGTNRSSMTLNLAGTFLGNAVADLAAEDLRIFIRRVASATGGGAGPTANPLRVHGGLYNFATFDDGATVGGSYIREATSSGNTVNITFGGFSCENGIYMEIEIANPGIKLDSVVVSFV